MFDSRWHTLWCLLSYDRTQPFLGDLWLRVTEPERFQTTIRAEIRPYLSNRRFWQGRGEMHLRIFRRLQREYRASDLVAFRRWARHIYAEVPRDRKAELEWSTLASYLRRPKHRAARWIRLAMDEVWEAKHARNLALDERLKQTDSLPLSGWDQRFAGVMYKDSTAKDAIVYVSNIAHDNHFLLAWRSVCGSFSPDQLVRLFEAAKKLAPKIGLHWQLVPFPGTWDVDLDDLIQAGNGGGIRLRPIKRRLTTA